MRVNVANFLARMAPRFLTGVIGNISASDHRETFQDLADSVEFRVEGMAEIGTTDPITFLNGKGQHQGIRLTARRGDISLDVTDAIPSVCILRHSDTAAPNITDINGVSLDILYTSNAGSGLPAFQTDYVAGDNNYYQIFFVSQAAGTARILIFRIDNSVSTAASGGQIFFGGDAPTIALGIDGDIYFRTNGDIFQKDQNAWVFQYNTLQGVSSGDMLEADYVDSGGAGVVLSSRRVITPSGNLVHDGMPGNLALQADTGFLFYTSSGQIATFSSSNILIGPHLNLDAAIIRLDGSNLILGNPEWNDDSGVRFVTIAGGLFLPGILLRSDPQTGTALYINEDGYVRNGEIQSPRVLHIDPITGTTTHVGYLDPLLQGLFPGIEIPMVMFDPNGKRVFQLMAGSTPDVGDAYLQMWPSGADTAAIHPVAYTPNGIEYGTVGKIVMEEESLADPDPAIKIVSGSSVFEIRTRDNAFSFKDGTIEYPISTSTATPSPPSALPGSRVLTFDPTTGQANVAVLPPTSGIINGLQIGDIPVWNGAAWVSSSSFSSNSNSLGAWFTWDGTEAGVPTVFSDESVGTPVSWSWDFGDTYTSTTQNPSHTYENPGTYTVSLTITDAQGAQSTQIRQIVIT